MTPAAPDRSPAVVALGYNRDMKKTYPVPQDNALQPFVQHYGSEITGILSGYDRLRLRGTLRSLYAPAVMERYLSKCHVRMLEFGTFVRNLSQRVRNRASELAERLGRPFSYVGSSRDDKEALARKSAATQGVTEGLITILACVEPCKSFAVRGGYADHLLHLVLQPRKCLPLYFYFIHRVFGFMHLRLQTWFPFQIDLCLNGREWLCRQLDAEGLAYHRQGNCVVHVQD